MSQDGAIPLKVKLAGMTPVYYFWMDVGVGARVNIHRVNQKTCMNIMFCFSTQN